MPGVWRDSERAGRAWWPLAIAAVAFAAVLLLWPNRSEAYVACEFGGGVLEVELNDREDSVRIVRGGDRIDVVIALADPFAGSERGFAVPCAGGQARVGNTDAIAVNETPNVIAGRLDIDLRGGPLAPGATLEPEGASEIELRATMGGRFSSVIVHGTVFQDRFDFGRAADGSLGANLNGAAEATPDVDVIIERAEIVAAQGRRGADAIQATGAPGFVQPLPGRGFAAGGGAGADRLVGARASSILHGGDGRDRLLGFKRTDYLAGGEGRDLLRSGRGADLVEAGRRDGRDQVDCGGGRDYSIYDRFDRVRSCGDLPRKRKGKRRFAKVFVRLFPAIFLVEDVFDNYAASLPAPEPVAPDAPEAPVPPASADNLPDSAE